MSRVNAPFAPAPLQANSPAPTQTPDAKSAEKPHDLGRLAVWIVLVVGVLVVADLLVARTARIWTAVVGGLLAAVFLALLINRPGSAKASPPDGSASDKSAQG